MQNQQILPTVVSRSAAVDNKYRYTSNVNFPSAEYVQVGAVPRHVSLCLYVYVTTQQ